MNEQAQAAALHIARRADDVIRKALSERLGYSDWTQAEVAHRVTRIAAPAGDTYVLDGTPFLWMGAPKVSQDETTGAISVDREWRTL